VITSLEAQAGDSEAIKPPAALHIHPVAVSQTFAHPFLKVNATSDTSFREKHHSEGVAWAPSSPAEGLLHKHSMKRAPLLLDPTETSSNCECSRAFPTKITHVVKRVVIFPKFIFLTLVT